MFKDMSYHCFFDGTLLYVGMYFTGYNIKALYELLARCMQEGAGEGTAMDPHAGTGKVRAGMVRVKTWVERAWK